MGFEAIYLYIFFGGKKLNFIIFFLILYTIRIKVHWHFLPFCALLCYYLDKSHVKKKEKNF